MAQHEWQAGGDLVRSRSAIAGRAPIDGVSKPNVFLASQASYAEHSVEELAGGPGGALAIRILNNEDPASADISECLLDWKPGITGQDH